MVVRTLESLIEDTIFKLYNTRIDVVLVVPKKIKNNTWHYATNVAYRLAGILDKKPEEIAQEIAASIPKHRYVDNIDTASGYVNIVLTSAGIADIVCRLHDAESLANFNNRANDTIVLEYVSANPTGPISVVNGRAAAIGSALVNILKTTGAHVQTHYYTNDNPDSGQILALKKTFDYYDKVAKGEDAEFPEDGYKGEYVKSVWEKYHPYADIKEGAFHAIGIQSILDSQYSDLLALKVSFGFRYREAEIMRGWRMDDLFRVMFGKNLSDYTYEKDGAVWLKTSEYGDEKDRVILRSDGRPTYFHNDIVYHAIKWHLARNPERANIQLINIFGADHHGYINRLNAVMRMWGIDDVSVILTQMVSLEATDASGETVSFIGSKREGQYLRLKEDFIDRVGVDAARWYFLSETPSAHLIINVDKATEQNMSNPVFYVQYAYARFTQILSKSETLGVSVDGVFANLSLLSKSDSAVQLILKLNDYEQVIQRAAENLSPHMLKTYLYELAQDMHQYYASERLIEQESDYWLAGLYLVQTSLKVLKHGLDLLDITAPQAMVALDANR